MNQLLNYGAKMDNDVESEEKMSNFEAGVIVLLAGNFVVLMLLFIKISTSFDLFELSVRTIQDRVTELELIENEKRQRRMKKEHDRTD